MNTERGVAFRATQAAPPIDPLIELSRGDRIAICEGRQSGDSWEVRLVVHDEVWYRERCATRQQVLDTADRWRRALVSKGWASRG